MVEPQFSKLMARVRFPSSPPIPEKVLAVGEGCIHFHVRRRYDHAMTRHVAPPLFHQLREKSRSPRWYRLRSTIFLGAHVVATALFVFVAVGRPEERPLFNITAAMAMLAAGATFITACAEMRDHRRPVASVFNAIAAAIINPFVALGTLVNAGVLDFG